ncbi:MAG: hypothetical protein K2I66_02810 [Bacteroidales bacterium]|nr:hypothetical protein [Bacteroidales bacterium]
MKTNLLTVWAKRAVPALALAGLAMTACDKEPVEKAPVYRAPYEKELRFSNTNADSIEMPIVQKFARDTACKHIYLTVTNDNNFTHLDADYINALRNVLDERIQLAPNKTSGRGNFYFRRGVARPADSIWFVQNGWTINQR